jgi:hypothetical protein
MAILFTARTTAKGLVPERTALETDATAAGRSASVLTSTGFKNINAWIMFEPLGLPDDVIENFIASPGHRFP